MKVVFYHNPACSKSRAVHQILLKFDLDLDIIEYLKQPFSTQNLQDIIDRINTPAAHLIRTNNATFKELGVSVEQLNDKQVVDILIAHPELFQRPVVVAGKHARIGRPPENVIEIIT